ncbi:hypothetical protein SNK04_014086 [Fusarium graminearum]
MDVEPDCLGRVVEIALVVRSLAIHVQLKPTGVGRGQAGHDRRRQHLACLGAGRVLYPRLLVLCLLGINNVAVEPMRPQRGCQLEAVAPDLLMHLALALESLSRLQIRAAFSAVITYPQGLCGLGRWPGARGSASVRPSAPR